MKAAVSIDGQHNRHFQKPLLAIRSIGLIWRSRTRRSMLVLPLNLKTEEVNHFLMKVDWALTFLVTVSLFYEVTRHISLDFVFIL